MMWFLIIQQVQLLNIALLPKPELSPKAIFNSLVEDSTESLPWAAFLVPSSPYKPLIESGFSYFATNEFVGPKSSLHLLIIFGPTNSNPTA